VDIRSAQTLPSAYYHDPELYARVVERAFAASWQFVPGAERVKAPGHVLPFTLLEGCLDEPLLLSRTAESELRCLSNVCTHRGALVVEGESHLRTLRCRYHGRRFDLDGRMTSMPEFEGVENFPSAADDLPRLPFEQWGPFAFTGVAPEMPFDEWIGPLRERCGHLPLNEAHPDHGSSRDYLMHANWALYVDNYLEEFHIPYVHQGSLDGLDYQAYRTETFDWGVLQLGVGKAGEEAFEVPAGHPDAGERVVAWYWWLFPNLMLNFYPWGCSVNIVQPLGPERTRVSFLSYVWDSTKRGGGAAADLHRVEMEDEEVVESVQRGVRSRLYDRGRYSPRRETGTYHFHRLLQSMVEARPPAAPPRFPGTPQRPRLV
jgi:choline monooxygenase